jgi:hypothetical protein
LGEDASRKNDVQIFTQVAFFHARHAGGKRVQRIFFYAEKRGEKYNAEHTEKIQKNYSATSAYNSLCEALRKNVFIVPLRGTGFYAEGAEKNTTQSTQKRFIQNPLRPLRIIPSVKLCVRKSFLCKEIIVYPRITLLSGQASES